jgi:RNA 2',3'-cyclic 3'-phosphodiesterase
MRTFFSLSLTDDAHECSHKLLGNIKKGVKEIEGADKLRFIRSANLHLTLKFLGEVPVVDLTTLLAIGRVAAKGMTPFTIRFSEFTRMGSSRRAVFCIGVKTNPTLQHLANRLEKDLVKQGYSARERKMLKPHVTLARLKKSNRRLEKVLKNIVTRDLMPRSMKVTGFDLMKSQLHPKGATYSVLERFEFEH